MLNTTRFRFLLLFACLLLIVIPVHAQDDEQELPKHQAFLAFFTDVDGAATVSLNIPAEVHDREQLQRVVAGSFSFPLQFDNSPTTWRYSFDETVDQAEAESKSQRPWTTISAKSPKAFSGGVLRPTCQIDLRSLLPFLRQYKIEHLKVLASFQNGTKDVKIQGARRIPAVDGSILYHYDVLIDVRAARQSTRKRPAHS